MALRYWKTLLLSSLLGASGLAVWANQENEEKTQTPTPTPIASPSAVSASPALAELPPPPSTPTIDLPKSPSLPVAPPVVPPALVTARVETSEPADEPPPIPKAALDLPPPPPMSPPAVAPPVVAAPAVIVPSAPTEVPTPRGAPRSEKVKPVAVATPIDSGSYKLHVRMGGNLGPRFEVRDGENLLLKVYCDHIDLHGRQEGPAILPGLTATGNVRFSGSGLNGTCDSLTIDAGDGMVRIKGHVKLTCYRGNASSQVTADALSFQLKGTQEVPIKARHDGH